MINIFKKIFLFIIISVCSFLLGYLYCKKDVSRIERQYEYVNTLNLLLNYQGDVRVSKEIKSGNTSSAQCLADVRASSEFDDLQKCLSKDACKVIIKKDVEENSQELLSGQKIPFRYYKSGEMCK